jgi:hypothetical protein
VNGGDDRPAIAFRELPPGTYEIIAQFQVDHGNPSGSHNYWSIVKGDGPVPYAGTFRTYTNELRRAHITSIVYEHDGGPVKFQLVAQGSISNLLIVYMEESWGGYIDVPRAGLTFVVTRLR